MSEILATAIPAKELAKRNDLTVKEALAVINFYDGEIKETAKNRKVENNRAFEKMFNKNLTRSWMAGVGAGIAGAAVCVFTGNAVDVAGPTIPLLISTFSPAVAGMLTMSALPKRYSFVHGILAPLAYRKVKSEKIIDDMLVQMSEEEFNAKAVKVLKKTKKAVKVLNESLAPENQNVVYSFARGSEGFSVQKNIVTHQLNQWELLAKNLEQPMISSGATKSLVK